MTTTIVAPGAHDGTMDRLAAALELVLSRMCHSLLTYILIRAPFQENNGGIPEFGGSKS
jgi:hypothetical protein